MKLFYILTFLIFSKICYSQSNYSLGVIFGPGINIYENKLNTDRNHFKVKNPISISFGVRLSKNLDEENKLFADLLFTRKKIEYEYKINESQIPFTNKDIMGQKFDCISLYVGYRRLFSLNEKLLYIEASVGADYNNNVMVYNRGSGQAAQDLSDTVFYEGIYETNIGEKSYTISTNLGFGINFGWENQYDLGLSLNFPFQQIQNTESTFQYIWRYKTNEYVHDLKYIGNIYYPSLRFTYYLF
nr:hypothetical protein [uncultured Chryseobacterium sp.]